MFSERGDDDLFEEEAGSEADEAGSVPLGVALRALAEAFVRVLGLADSGDGAADDERRWVQPELGGELELLFGVEGGGVTIIDGEEVGDEAEEALLLRGVDLFLGDFDLGLGDVELVSDFVDG